MGAPKVNSECKAGMEEQAESRLEMMARVVARQEAQRAVEACVAREAAEEEAAAIGAKEEATFGTEQEEEAEEGRPLAPRGRRRKRIIRRGWMPYGGAY